MLTVLGLEEMVKSPSRTVMVAVVWLSEPLEPVTVNV